MNHLKRKYDCFVRVNTGKNCNLFIQVIGKREFNKCISYMSDHYKTGSLLFCTDGASCRIHVYLNPFNPNKYEIYGFVCDYTGADYHEFVKDLLCYYDHMQPFELYSKIYVSYDNLYKWHILRTQEEAIK